MTTAQEQKLSSRPATVDDMIGWLTEQAFHSGQTGFTAICDPRDINTLAFVRPSSHLPCLATPLSAEVDISTALGHAIGDWHRDQYLTNVVRANKTMLRETEEAVHGRLRRAGMQAQEFEMIKQQKLGLRGKIARLHELETQHLRPRSGDIFVIWLIKEEDALKEKVKVILPKKGSYTHFLAVLRDVWLAKVDPDVQLEQSLGFGAGAWTYQLINKQLQVVAAAPRVKLLDEIGYREMIKQITRKGSVTPSAVFWHVGRHSKMSHRLFQMAEVLLRNLLFNLWVVAQAKTIRWKTIRWKT